MKDNLISNQKTTLHFYFLHFQNHRTLYEKFTKPRNISGDRISMKNRTSENGRQGQVSELG